MTPPEAERHLPTPTQRAAAWLNLTAPVAAATPNFRHLEWFADHDRIESRYLDGILDPTGGTVHIGLDASGHGMRFKSADAERFRVS
jgi:hypothetical protein